MKRARWPRPPGLDIDVELRVSEYFAEWAAHCFDVRLDTLLTLSILMVLYDAVITPCFWLLPMQVEVSVVLIGIVIDVVFLTVAALSCFVWGIRGQVVRAACDVLTCMPWELIGFATDAAAPNLMLRTLAKVRSRRAHSPSRAAPCRRGPALPPPPDPSPFTSRSSALSRPPSTPFSPPSLPLSLPPSLPPCVPLLHSSP